MKKLEKEFSGNYDRVGINKFVQLRKENGVAMYERFNTDGTHRGYEVFIIKTVPKGAPLPNGKTVEESYESYPGSSQFGKTAYDCRTMAQAEERFDQLVQKVKDSVEAKEEAIKTGKPNKGRRGSANKKTVVIPEKGSKFNMRLLITNTGLTQPVLFSIVKEWEKNGLIKINGYIKAEGGRGRPSIEYIVV
jgi:hypothetical protein